MLVGTVIGAGALVLATQQASAATSAVFTRGVLTVFGDGGNNDVRITRDSLGTIVINGGAIRVLGGTPTVANTQLIHVVGLGGNDTIRLDEAGGALPRAILFGGSGNDVLTGGAGGDLLFGQDGNDVLRGQGGADSLFGGRGNDTLLGGDADDKVFGESGNDRMVWNPGDDTDLNEGGAGIDTTEVNGGDGAESFTATADGARVRFDRVDPAPFSIDMGATEHLVLNANGGDDRFAAAGNLAALITLTVDGGAGNDHLIGGNGVDLLVGGAGNDVVDGQQGNDVALLGTGDDLFQWDPGDGSDVVEGQDGMDTMVFNGSGGNERFDASANGRRLRFTRDLGNIVMDTDGIEIVDLNALAGVDELVVNDLTVTDVVQVDTDLAAASGGTTGDGQSDTVIVNGTGGDDVIDVVGSGTSASVVGLAAQVNITNTDAAGDALVVNALDGGDSVNASTLPAGVVTLTIDGGDGGDSLLGSQAADTILGGGGGDVVDGQQGDDVALLGTGDDVFRWDPGDGSDVVEGQDGTDRMLFNGANASENVDVSANGGRVRFFRDVANVVMDLDDVESVDFIALGGADNVVVNDLSGTDLTAIRSDLSGAAGGGDGQVDTITVNGTNSADNVSAEGDAAGIDVFGLHATVSIVSPEVANDRLTLNALGGDDVVDATALAANAIQLTMNGGLGADTLLGSAGNDVLIGGDGEDLALMGAGDDRFVWNPGDDDDVLEGQAGLDTMTFNGANIAENIDIAANGGRVRFFRNVANVTMDLDDVERIDFAALGGADTIVTNDLTGTDVTEINTDLGAGDGQTDNVVVQATNGDDVIVVSGDSGGTAVFGLAAQINIANAEPGIDRLTVNALAGDDVVDASGLRVGAIRFTANGDAGDDVIIGGDGDDVLNGGEGDDVLLGGPGTDVIDGGGGDDIEIQLFTGDAVTPAISASVADDAWLAEHARILDGTTVVDVGGEERPLPVADLSALIDDTTSS